MGIDGHYALGLQLLVTPAPNLLADPLVVGTRYTVRGFSDAQTLAGHRGGVLRQEWRGSPRPALRGLTWSPFVGVDVAGVVLASAVAHAADAPSIVRKRSWLAGVTVGTRVVCDGWQAEFSLSTPLHLPAGLGSRSIVPSASVSFAL